MKKNKKVSKYSILSSLSLIIGFSLNILFENSVFPVVGLVFCNNGSIVLNIIYRIQIKNIYKQVDFIKEHDTNKIINQSINFKEITVLVNKLNELIAVQRDMTREYKIKDEILKDTKERDTLVYGVINSVICLAFLSWYVIKTI